MKIAGLFSGEYLSGSETGPHRSIEDAMIGLKMRVLMLAHNP